MLNEKTIRTARPLHFIETFEQRYRQVVTGLPVASSFDIVLLCSRCGSDATGHGYHRLHLINGLLGRGLYSWPLNYYSILFRGSCENCRLACTLKMNPFRRD